MPVMLSASLALWFIGAFIEIVGPEHCGVSLPEMIAGRCISLLSFIATAYLLNSIRLFERRAGWLLSLLMWLAALSWQMHDNSADAFSMLMVVVSLAVIFSCQQAAVESRIYTSSLIVGALSFLVPLSLWLLPLLFVFMFMTNMFTPKRMLAMLLGAITPFWLVYGTIYVYPEASVCADRLHGFVINTHIFASTPSLGHILSAVIDLLLLLPASVAFMTSSSPAKPMLRKRLQFMTLLGFYLVFLSFAYPSQEVLLVWRIPVVAVMAAYLFSLKVTKVSNLYFIFMNIIWLAKAALSVWLK